VSKVLIFIVAYNAEKHLVRVLERIPYDELPDGTEVLVIDDSSQDGTFEIGVEYQQENVRLPLTVLRTPVNQGYGGNQKLGYEYAIQQGFGYVVLLHGDGQYAPEELPNLLGPLLNGEADAAFGSRMLGNPIRGGMPLYKYLGNRILTVFQNWALAMNLTEFHSGYRAYSVEALKKLPFEFNTNVFHFDTEIIIQLRQQNLRIVEVPIPTYYGDEICYVEGIPYAWNVTKATIASRLQRLGILYRRRFDPHLREFPYKLKLGYPSSHTMAIEAVGEGEKVLDIGCGKGDIGAILQAKKGCRVTGIDQLSEEEVPSGRIESFISHDLHEGTLPEGLAGDFDTILMLDVIEHLRDVERFLDNIRARFGRSQPRLIITTPNIGFFVTRFGLLLGSFNYGRRGILDLTHTRIFTFASLRNLLEESGFQVKKLRGIPAPFPEAFGEGFLSRSSLSLNRFLLKLLPRVFSYQVLVEARIAPNVPTLLEATLGRGGSSKPDS
jgi:glycosyltransferase involved in cell wall biosynthesis